MPDYNWLYSSIAQSSAAVVGIIAGFVISRLMSANIEEGLRKTQEKKLVNNMNSLRAILSDMDLVQ